MRAGVTDLALAIMHSVRDAAHRRFAGTFHRLGPEHIVHRRQNDRVGEDPAYLVSTENCRQTIPGFICICARNGERGTQKTRSKTARGWG